MTTNIPHINLLCMEDKFIAAFQNALETLRPPIPHTTSNSNTYTIGPITLTTHNTSLSQLPPSTKYDLIVSPANSYGRLDGSFDDAISRAFCLPDHPYDTLTRAAQRVLYDKHRGFAPPGSCTLVPFPAELLDTDTSDSTARGRNPWGCAWVAICPTMRVPDDVRWDREVVYECVWSLLCAVEGWNRGCLGDGDAARIRSILVTPMATGCGGVDATRWAEQFVLALAHFGEAVMKPERWGGLGWEEIYRDVWAVQRTWKGEEGWNE
ncbi:uncharacterized protein DSM5745_06765 [Aspergillus mulundensis]|uniref:ADP-ribose 1''-phosphate phosphatase n=1 Tax=Aspergillus mulundensis TaxID=1810919 RepID=A0A3D8RRS5_9EURO|nr:hypothetical protein DSM5745_06765 [Aspergillus mulundensis]RDW76773.1 hypothetical protein DSM5745_06765 [Aspergillus mulundensis]